MRRNKIWGMDPLQVIAFALILVSQLMYSCSSRRVYHPPKPQVQNKSFSNAYRETRIISSGQFSSRDMARYLVSRNPKAQYKSAEYIARVYIEESRAEGVNHDIAFAQMCHETKFLLYGNQVKSWQHNYCGLGATDDGSKGLSFPDVRTGVRAHIQHLKAYGSRYPLRNRLVDPRFKYVKRGSAPTIDHLAGSWASDPYYARHLRKHLNNMSGVNAL